MAQQQRVTFRGGFTADWGVVSRLLDIEARGARLRPLEVGPQRGFEVDPPEVMTPEDRVFLWQHKDQVRDVLVYCETMQSLVM